MLSQPPRSCLVLEPIGDVAVIRFSQRSLLGADLIEKVAAELLRAVEELGYRKLILNLGNVESMTSAMVSKIVVLKQVAEAHGGRLILCKINPFLFEIFQVLQLTKSFTICDEELTALDRFRGQN